MKTITRPTILLVGAVLLLVLGICIVFGQVGHAAVDCGASEKFSDAELDAAIRCAKSSFIRNFSGCELLKVCYDEEEAQRVIDGYLYHGPGKGTSVKEENLLVLFLDFKTGERASPALNPNAVYYQYGATLLRDRADGPWKVVEWGY